MNDELNNNQGGPTKSTTDDLQVNSCTKCGKNPCVCPDNSNGSGQKNSIEKPKRTKPPKISWI